MYNPTKPYKQKILRLIESTWHTPHVKVTRGVYPIITKKFAFPEVHHTDGIGTKGVYHWRQRTFKNAVQDTLAMNLNDLAMAGAVPYALQNHIVLPEDDHAAILEIVRAMARECRKRNIAMTGGETSIHDNAEGMDISITMAGFLPEIRKNECRAGDVLIGIKSNGLHANGLTKVREVFRDAFKNDFTEPTAIYFDAITPLLAQCSVNGMVHITGGAFTKIKNILGKKLNAVIGHPKKLIPQKIFYALYQKGISSEEMYTTFNCGIGFILSVPQESHQQILRCIKGSAIIGSVVPGKGRIEITSAFNRQKIWL